jgi:23S rRNA pseudouridine2605 synthase
MRLNKYVASASSLSRRSADQAIGAGRITVNRLQPNIGQEVEPGDEVTLDGTVITPNTEIVTIMLNKPAGIVVSRDGQGSKTVYDLLPPEYQQLNPIGRLDKYSSGLLLLTSDGQLAQELTHPSRQKVKVYEVFLDKRLEPLHQQMISDHGITLEDGVSKLTITKLGIPNSKSKPLNSAYEVSLHEGRNRQIRRTFESLGYRVTHLHRTSFGTYSLEGLKSGQILVL